MRKMDLKRSGYTFRRNWFRNRNLSTFRDYVFPEWYGERMLYLEIGVFEGQSICWMLEHVLTGGDARAVGIDPWLLTTKIDGQEMEEVMNRAVANVGVATGSRAEKCALIRANSAEALRRMCGNRDGWMGVREKSVDVCMIDGDHNSLAVVDDARHVLPLMKPGGWMLFDDVENDREKQVHVKQGLAMWFEEAGDSVRLLWKDRYVECYEVMS